MQRISPETLTPNPESFSPIPKPYAQNPEPSTAMQMVYATEAASPSGLLMSPAAILWLGLVAGGACASSEQRIYIELMTSDRKLKASRESSK